MPEAIPFHLTPAPGITLRGLEWSLAGQTADSAPLVIILPGRAEPAEKYAETASDLLADGMPVWAVDWRGQGLSTRHPDPAISRRGHLERFDDLVADLDHLLHWHRQHSVHQHRPVILLAHSMGGAVVLRWLQTRSPAGLAVRGIVLSAPMISIPTWGTPQWLARLLARLAVIAGHEARYVPGHGGWGLRDDCQFEGNRRTSDPRRFAREVALLQARPDLRVGGPTWNWLHQAFRLTRQLAAPWPSSPAIPMLVLVGSDDPYVPHATHHSFFSRFPQATLRQIPAARHELLAEHDACRAEVLRAITLFRHTEP